MRLCAAMASQDLRPPSMSYAMGSDSNDSDAELRRLKWRCRRGMLELDVLLEGFVESGYGELNEHEREAFVRFLESQDQDLYNWLLNQIDPRDGEFSNLVDKIRASALR